MDKMVDSKRRASTSTAVPKELRNTLDEDAANPYQYPVAKIAKCYDDASPAKHRLEYNRFHGFESVLSCISDDLYHDTMDSSKKRP